MALYGCSSLQGGTAQAMTTTPGKTLINIASSNGTALKRASLFGFSVGQQSVTNATDCSVVWDLSRTTAAGTGTSATPNPKDPADATSLMVCTINYTAEPTFAAAGSGLNLWSDGLNQRGSFQFQTTPELGYKIPATNLAGLALRVFSDTYTGKAVATMDWQDQ